MDIPVSLSQEVATHSEQPTRSIRQLRLSQETVRTLSAQEREWLAAGGAQAITRCTGCTCVTAVK